jgi:hypothetical protein
MTQDFPAFNMRWVRLAIAALNSIPARFAKV